MGGNGSKSLPKPEVGPNKFIILGHGEENIISFKKRDKIPSGYTLVTLAESGVVATDEDVCPMIRIFSEDDIGLATPISIKSTIEERLDKPIHIYTEGMKYPKLQVQLFTDWFNENNTSFMKSGVYKYPLNAEHFTLSPENTDFCQSQKKTLGPYKNDFIMNNLPDGFSVDELFSESLVPTVEQVNVKIGEIEAIKAQSPVSESLSNRLKTSLTMSLEDIFAICGPGVYYYVVCRSPLDVPSPERLLRDGILENSENIHPFLVNDWIGTIPELLPVLNRKIAESRNPSWSRSELLKARNQYRKLEKVPIIRRKSISQQTHQLGGKTCRTRKLRKVTRKH